MTDSYTKSFCLHNSIMTEYDWFKFKRNNVDFHLGREDRWWFPVLKMWCFVDPFMQPWMDYEMLGPRAQTCERPLIPHPHPTTQHRSKNRHTESRKETQNMRHCTCDLDTPAFVVVLHLFLHLIAVSLYNCFVDILRFFVVVLLTLNPWAPGTVPGSSMIPPCIQPDLLHMQTLSFYNHITSFLLCPLHNYYSCNVLFWDICWNDSCCHSSSEDIPQKRENNKKKIYMI